MNRFAGIASATMDAPSRAARLRAVLAKDTGEVTTVEISAHVSVAYCGNARLFGISVDGPRACALYGGCHAAPSGGIPACRVDDPEAAAATLLLRRATDKKGFLLGVAGSFVGAIADGDDGVLLFSDPGGTRSLFVGESRDGMAFASHPLTCARVLGHPRLDRSYEDFLLVYGFLPDGRTVYSGIRSLAAGTATQWNARNAADVLALAMHAPELPIDPRTLESEDELHESLYNVLIDCLREQLPAERNVGVLLGGFDSALVASLLHRLGKRVTTYSFHYDAAEFNQPHTDTLAKFLGTEHRWIEITPGVIAHGLARYASIAPQPTNWLNYVVQTVHVCERMRGDGIDFAYSGDGCDAIFLGYPGTYKRTRVFARLPRLPAPLARAALAIFGRPSLDRWLGHPYRMALNLLRAAQRPMPTRAFLTFRVLDELSLRQLRRDAAPSAPETIEAMLHRLAQPHANTSIQRLGYLAKGFVSPNKCKLSASIDASGVLISAPYLHPRLKAFASRIPDDLLRKQNESGRGDPGKACLMRMARKYRLLPDDVIFQPKLAAIDSPIDAWFAAELRSCLNELLAYLPFQADQRYLESLITPTLAETLYKKYVSSTRVLSDAASLLATYAGFHRETLA